MADENEGTSPEEQALADEWAAALAEAGDDAGQADIDALMAQGGGGAAAPAAPRMAMEEFGSAPKPGNGPVALEGPNLDVILDIPVSISMKSAVPRSAFATSCSSIRARWWNSIAWPASR